MVFEQQDSFCPLVEGWVILQKRNKTWIFVVSVAIKLSTCIVNPQIDGQKSWWFGETVL